MSRIAYVDGRYVPHRQARVHIEDRGFQFADGVYEVVAVKDGEFVDIGLHLKRLGRSLGELRIAPPMSEAAMRMVMREMVRRNGVRDGLVYLQVTRGTAPRDFGFPRDARPSIVMTSRRQHFGDPRLVENGVSVITIPDIRWGRCDIKSVGLLASVLGKQQAREAGAYEAWQVDRDGNVTEGTSSNAWIITPAGEVATRNADAGILNGVTRLGMLHILEREGLTFAERPFSLAEAKAAREAFLTSSTSFLMPVVRIDGGAVGDGRVGPVCRKLRAHYVAYIAQHGQDR